MPEAVVDASALVEMLIGSALGEAVRSQLESQVLHAPAHVDLEVLSALARLERAGALSPASVRRGLKLQSEAPIQRHLLADLLAGAYRRRKSLRVSDALYVELGDRLDCRVLTTDQRLARATARATLIA